MWKDARESSGEAGLERWAVLATISFGTLISVLNASVVNVALPTISRVMRLGVSQAQWVVVVFLFTVAASLLVFGRLADIVGRKRVYATGFLVLILGSLACGLAPNLPVLLAGRFVQGLGAAMPMADGMALTGATFPACERGRALGILGSTVAVGGLLGPVLGGFLVAALGWRWVFLFNVPLGLLAYLAALSTLPGDSYPPRREALDYPGVFLLALSMVFLVLALSGGSGAERGSWFALACGLLGVFFWWERKQETPLLELELFRLPLFTSSLGAAFLAHFSMAGVLLLAPFYLEEVLGFSPREVGLLMSPYPVVMFLVSPWSGLLSDRYGSVGLATGGLFLNALGLFLLGFSGGTTCWWKVALALALLGFGMGMFQSPNNAAVMGAVPPPKLGVAGGLNALMRNLGMMAGTSGAVSVFDVFRSLSLKGESAPPEAAFLAGWKAALFLAAAAAAAGGVLSAARARFGPAPSGAFPEPE